MFSTNVTGLINMTQSILSIYKKREDGGKGDIINIGSIAGREGYPGGSIYCATKAAVRNFTDALRRELIATRIRVMEVVCQYRNLYSPMWRPAASHNVDEEHPNLHPELPYSHI